MDIALVVMLTQLVLDTDEKRCLPVRWRSDNAPGILRNGGIDAGQQSAIRDLAPMGSAPA
jgi:hypothetical protein